MDDKAEKIALFRYGLIAALSLEKLPRGELTRRAEEIASRPYEIPNSKRRGVSVDTLLEKIVLLLALGGVWSLARDTAWDCAPAPLGSSRHDDTLRLLGQVLPPLGIVVGIYIVWVGADAPGGAFQGGAVLAAMWILALMARLADPPAVGRSGLRLAATIGPIVFLAIGLAGFALPGGFLSYPAGFAKPLIIVIEVVLTLSIAVILGLLVLGPPAREVER